MIHSFKWSNFFSFAEENEVSFVVGKTMPKDNSIFFSQSNRRLSKIIAVLGPNASGKTNLLKVLPFLRWLMLSSFQSGEAGKMLRYSPFAFHKPERPSIIEIEFEEKGILFRYHISFSKNQILAERLFEKRESRFSYLFKRENNKGKKVIQIRNLGVTGKTLDSILRSNATLFSTLIQTENQKILQIARPISNLSADVDRLGRFRSDNFSQLLDASEYFNKNPKALNKHSNLVKTFDLGLSDLRIRLIKSNKEANKEISEFPFLFASHKFRGVEKTFPFFEESSGTQRILILLKQMLSVMEIGGILILDEFEFDLHPLVIPHLLKTFIDPTLNPKNAQLLLSTHSADVINELHKQQIVLVEKNSDGSSECWRLDEMKGVRSDENHLSKYLSGAYGAIPEIG